MKKLTKNELKSIYGGSVTACASCGSKPQVCCTGDSCSATDGVGCSCASSTQDNSKKCEKSDEELPY
ncbi:MAG: bacteriocin [Chitinophagaceae bacterium]|jgi:bacteriocin-like protein|nr:bacteriocin [Chitinophagaceae bacterium]